MYFVSCSAFIVDNSEIELRVFLKGIMNPYCVSGFFWNARICSYKAGKSVLIDYDSVKFNETMDSYKIPIITVC